MECQRKDTEQFRRMFFLLKNKVEVHGGMIRWSEVKSQEDCIVMLVSDTFMYLLDMSRTFLLLNPLNTRNPLQRTQILLGLDFFPLNIYTISHLTIILCVSNLFLYNYMQN